jgi:glycosyltransferase involved in cell wall biosynthesis
VINPGINNIFKSYPKKKRARADSPAIIWVGRKFKIKGLGIMLQAFQIVRKTKRNAKIMIITPDKINVRMSKNISVKSLLPMEELAKAYASADIYVSTSIFEGLCLPPLEAMASGTPVVTTNSIGVMEYAKNGINSIVVPRSDPSDIARAILSVLNDKKLAEKIVSGGMKTARRFTWQRTINKFEKYFAGLIPAKQGTVNEKR